VANFTKTRDGFKSIYEEMLHLKYSSANQLMYYLHISRCYDDYKGLTSRAEKELADAQDRLMYYREKAQGIEQMLLSTSQ
jgi:hypothetical protein